MARSKSLKLLREDERCALSTARFGRTANRLPESARCTVPQRTTPGHLVWQLGEVRRRNARRPRSAKPHRIAPWTAISPAARRALAPQRKRRSRDTAASAPAQANFRRSTQGRAAQLASRSVVRLLRNCDFWSMPSATTFSRSSSRYPCTSRSFTSSTFVTLCCEPPELWLAR